MSNKVEKAKEVTKIENSWEVSEKVVHNRCDEEIDTNPEVANDNDLCQWIETANKTYVPSSKIKLRNNIPAGIYDIDIQNDRYVLKKQSINLDELLFLPMSVFDTVLNDMNFFWTHEENF